MPTKQTKSTKSTKSRPRRVTVVPDRVDLRDRPYQPEVSLCPPSELFSLEGRWLTDRDQGNSGACTGFALAAVVDHLLDVAGRAAETPVSPHMLYSMARRYDAIPGSPSADTGSSVRAALKGWHRHGVCRERLWDSPDKPRTPASGVDWWQEAVKRPLGAYYRVDTRSVTDMHVALSEVGVLYASSICHEGWDAGFELPASRRRDWTIPTHRGRDDDPGHAFAIVGYDAEGFYIQNSWGRRWGDDGLARLRYDDWLDNAMDCWVVQLGVVTGQHRAVARARSLRTDDAGHVSLAPSEELRNHEIAPLVVNVGNDGKLSSRGRFRTTSEDLDAIWRVSLPEFLATKKRAKDAPLDIALYAHGGLVDEKAAAKTAAKWIPALYDAGVFPIFFMWQTGLLDTLGGILADGVRDLLHIDRPTAGLRDQIRRFWNQRIEGLLAAPGTAVWGEMKENAALISAHDEAGGVMLYEASRGLLERSNVRVHLIGHSAGSILHAHLVGRLVAAGVHIESVSFMAPAARVDLFETRVAPHLASGAVSRYRQLHLREAAEQKDGTCRPLLGYGRSLLYLVSRSFEGGTTTPILGLEASHDAMLPGLPRAARRRMTHEAVPGALAQTSTHGAFDDDAEVLADVLRHIAG